MKHTDNGFVRRNTVVEWRAAAIAAVAALAAALSGANPVGSQPLDAVLTGLAVGAVTWAAASAPWWAVAGFAGLSGATALPPVWAAFGFAAFLAGLYIGVRQRDHAELRAAVAGVALNVLLHSRLEGFFGLASLVGITATAALFVLGIRRRPRAIRRSAWISAGCIAGLGVLAAAGFVLSASSSASALRDGNRLARDAIDSIDDGEYQTAADRFAAARRAFERAERQLNRPWAVGAAMVPGAAQNRSAAVDVVEAAAAVAVDVEVALRTIDPERLRLSGGQVDLAEVTRVDEALAEVDLALSELRRVLDDSQSPWLLGPFTDRLQELDQDLDENAARLDTAQRAVELAPGLLGADRPRTYLVLFTTPSEARGITGFPGNYAELTADQGRITLHRFGRVSEIEAYVAEHPLDCTGCPEEFVARYGRFGFDFEGGITTRAWSNITMPAHFPYTAEAAAALYPRSGGRPIDGVIAMDPYVLQTLIGYTGPIVEPDTGQELNASNAAPFMLEDQYEIPERAERIDAIDYYGRTIITSLLGGATPDPITLVDDLGPLVDEHRLLFWSADPGESAFFDFLGLLGSLPPLADGEPGFGMTVANATGTKLEVFLQDEVDVRLETVGGEQQLVANAVLTNNAPTSGVPDVMIGNVVGLPVGTTRLWVTFYGPPGAVAITRDGEEIEPAIGREAGWTTYSAFADIAAGDSTEFELRFPTDATNPGAIVTWRQPMVQRQSP